MATTRKTTPKAAPKAAAAPAAKKNVQAVDAAVIAGQETVDTVVKTSTAVATKGVEKVVAMTEEQVAAAVKASKDAYKGYGWFPSRRATSTPWSKPTRFSPLAFVS